MVQVQPRFHSKNITSTSITKYLTRTGFILSQVYFIALCLCKYLQIIVTQLQIEDEFKRTFIFFSVSADDPRACTGWISINILTHECPAAEHCGIHSAAAANTASATSTAATGATATKAIPTFPKPDWQCFRLPKYADSVVLWTVSERRDLPLCRRRVGGSMLWH